RRRQLRFGSGRRLRLAGGRLAIDLHAARVVRAEGHHRGLWRRERAAVGIGDGEGAGPAGGARSGRADHVGKQEQQRLAFLGSAFAPTSAHTSSASLSTMAATSTLPSESETV